MLLKSISCVKIKLFCVLTGQRLSDIIEKLSNNWLYELKFINKATFTTWEEI